MNRLPVVPQEKELAEIQEIFNQTCAPSLEKQEQEAVKVFLDSIEDSE